LITNAAALPALHFRVIAVRFAGIVMNRIIPRFYLTLLLAAGAILISVQCVRITDVPQGGTIQGRIIDWHDQGVPEFRLHISGTNFSAVTDSAGRYSIFNVPAGYYTITTDTGKHTMNVSVIDGQTVIVPDVKILANEYPITSYFLDQFYFVYLDSARMNQKDNIYLDNQVMYFGIAADSVALEFQVLMAANSNPIATTTAIYQNRTRIYGAVPPKGRVRTGTIVLHNADTLDFYVAGEFVQEIIIAPPDSNILPRLSVSVAPAKITGWKYGTDKPFFVLGLDTLCPSYSDTDNIDWDLYLVNNALQDTCGWWNRSPDWGTIGYTDDDPIFGGDQVVLPVQPGDTLYVPDCIQCPAMAPGLYSIYIRYNDGPKDSIQAKPLLSIELGSRNNNSEIMHFIQCTSVQPLKKGETWFAGTLEFPSMRYIPNGIAATAKRATGHRGNPQ
jgi:hypothetical protein